jgi:endonuclease/exonuclease/phosphatase (EEP) superfamily protein YafD
VVLALVTLLHLAGDRWWPATLLMFGPRWIWAAPMALLLPAVLLLPPERRRRFAPVPLVAAAALVWLVMGLCVPWRTLADGGTTAARPMFRVLTCNIDGSALDADRLREVLIDTDPDVVVLQAWSSHHQRRVFGDLGWEFRRDDELFVASRFPIRDARPLVDAGFAAGPGAAARYELALPGGRTVSLVNVHLATPRDALTRALARSPAAARAVRDNSALRHAQCAAVARWAAGESLGTPVVIAGDFNTPAESRIFPAALPDYANAFTRAGWGWGRTHFTRRTAVRIDHVFCGPGVVARRCWVGPDVGSAHRPVIAEVELSNTAW